MASVGSIPQTGFANLHLGPGEVVCVIKRTMSGGKAKVLSKKPSRTFISIKARVRFKAIHHYRDEHNTLRRLLAIHSQQPSVLQWTCEKLSHNERDVCV